MHIYSINW